MMRMTRREFLKKRYILELLREQGYPTYAKLFNMFALHLTKNPDVVAYMDPIHNEIVVNDDLDIKSVSTVVRHEILHEYFTHYAREMTWNKNHNRTINHRTANIAGDYDISNRGYTDEDKQIVRSLTINNKIMRGLVTEDDRPDLIDKSFEEMLDILAEDDKDIEQQMQQEIQQNQSQQQDGGNGNNQSTKSSSSSSDDNSSNGNNSDSNGNDADDDFDQHQPNQIGYKGTKESREKERAEREAQIDKEIADGSNLSDESENDDDDDSSEERSLKIKKAFDDIATGNIDDSDLIREINLAKQAENIAKRARDLARYNESPIRKFQMSFTNFLKRAMGLSRGKTWSRINKTYTNSGILKPGLSRRKPNKVPSVNVYFDRSGSWDSRKTKQGYDIISTFNNYVKQGRLKINLFYFSANVHSDEQSAIKEGSTRGQPILNHINATKPDNVVIMTDDDIYDCKTPVTVPGGVWLLFVGGRSNNLISHIHGKALTETYNVDINY